MTTRRSPDSDFPTLSDGAAAPYSWFVAELNLLPSLPKLDDGKRL